MMNGFKGRTIDCVWIDETPNPSVWQDEVGVIHVPPSRSPLDVPCWLALEAMRRDVRRSGTREIAAMTGREIDDAIERLGCIAPPRSEAFFRFQAELHVLRSQPNSRLRDVEPKPQKPKTFDKWLKSTADLLDECQNRRK